MFLPRLRMYNKILDIWDQLDGAQLTITDANLTLLRNIYRKQPTQWRMDFVGSRRVPKGDELREKLMKIHQEAVRVANANNKGYRYYRDYLMDAFPGPVDLHYSGTHRVVIKIYVLRN